MGRHRQYSESKIKIPQSTLLPSKKRGILKLNNHEFLSDPRNSTIFNVKSSSKFNPQNKNEISEDFTALNAKKQRMRDLREFRPPSIITNPIAKPLNPDLGSEITGLLEQQTELFQRLIGVMGDKKQKKRESPFKKAAERYEGRIEQLEKHYFANGEVMNLQNQLLELQKQQKDHKKQRPDELLHSYIYQRIEYSFFFLIFSRGLLKRTSTTESLHEHSL